jgi:hypothetical protein
MVGLTPHATHSWTSLMIKLFLHPRLLYPSYWELPDGPPCRDREPIMDVDLFATLSLASGMYCRETFRIRRLTLSAWQTILNRPHDRRRLHHP